MPTAEHEIPLALAKLDPDMVARNDLVLAGLPEAARLRWEAFVTTTAGHTFLSEPFRAAERRGKAEGEVLGQANALLTVLEVRGVPVPEDIRHRILSCADHDQLAIWVRRAAVATTADDVMHDQSPDTKDH
jgi:hypothetical protein